MKMLESHKNPNPPFSHMYNGDVIPVRTGLRMKGNNAQKGLGTGPSI